jgi:hypothetical protein
MDYFTKWPEAYIIPNQEASTVAHLFCRFGVRRELHSDQGRNFESHMIQEVLQRLEVSKTRIMSLQPQSDGRVEYCIQTVEGHLRKVVASHHKDWEAGLPIFFLDYRSPTHDKTDLTPVGVLFEGVL